MPNVCITRIRTYRHFHIANPLKRMFLNNGRKQENLKGSHRLLQLLYYIIDIYKTGILCKVGDNFRRLGENQYITPGFSFCVNCGYTVNTVRALKSSLLHQQVEGLSHSSAKLSPLNKALNPFKINQNYFTSFFLY